MSKKITKRDFIRYSLLGGGAFACVLCEARLAGFAGSFWNNNSGNLPNVSDKKEAYHYIVTPRGIQCRICPNDCILEEGETGDCRTRISENGKLFTIAYGNPCAVHIDPIEKKPLFHFYPQSKTFSVAIAGCNLACLNCQNWEISQSSPNDTRNYELSPENLIEHCQEYNCDSISYTYSEPIAFYEYTFDSAKIARSKGVKNVMVSAGYIHEKPLRQLCKYIDAANIDLKSFSDEIYAMLNAGKLEPVLNTLKILKEEGVWLEITNLIVPEWTDDTEMIKKMCGWLVDNGFESTPIHFSRFHPLHKLKHLPPTPIKTLENARKIALSQGLKYVYIGNVPNTQAENTYCPGCKKKLIKRRGFNIKENLILNSKCPECGYFIAGQWS